jgi:hypothetical protein
MTPKSAKKLPTSLSYNKIHYTLLHHIIRIATYMQIISKLNGEDETQPESFIIIFPRHLIFYSQSFV